MYISKFWVFLLTVAATVAITIALIMPRPAERAALKQEDKTVRKACLITKILLRDNARSRIQNTSAFAQAVRQAGIAKLLYDVSSAETITAEANGTGRSELTKLLETVPDPKPSFVWLLDKNGRVVARSNLNDSGYGDSMRGYFVVQDALDGYVRDDLWMMEDGLYRVAAAPILTKKLNWAGAIVLGRRMDKAFAGTLSKSIDADINFYVSGKSVASSNPVQIHQETIAGSEELSGIEEGQDCASSEILRIGAGGKNFAVVSSRLPGEAGEQGAFYSVFIEQAPALDFMGMLKSAKKDDLSFDRFPWMVVALLFIGLLLIGFFLLHIEVGKPLGRLAKDAVAMAKGDKDRFAEDLHKGKYGSIARSVNIGIEKTHRESKASKKDLNQLLGPAPEAGIDAAASALPPMEQVAPPHPSQFKFDPNKGKKPAEPPKPMAMPGMSLPTPPPPTPPPVATENKSALPAIVTPSPSAKNLFDEDILGASSPADEELATIAGDTPGNYFQQVYEEFIALKKQCGESTDTLTFERFSKKLQNNQDALIEKHHCSSVKFQVYVKDGRAALKASPVK